MAHDARRLPFIDNRAHFRGRVQWITGLHRLGPFDQFFNQSVFDRTLNIKPGIGGAHLALIEENSKGSHIGGCVQIFAIGKDDVGAFAARFGPDLLQVRLARVLHEQFAGGCRSGKGKRVHIHMQAERPARCRAKPRHHVEHTIRHARLCRQLRKPEGGQGRLLGGFQDNRVAGSQCRCRFPSRHIQRKIPRHHGSDNPQRHTAHNCQIAGARRGHLVIHLVDCLGVPLKEMRRPGRIYRGGISHELAHIKAVQQCHFFKVGPDQVGQLQQHRLAPGRSHARPAPIIKRTTPGSDGQIDIGYVTGGYRCQHRAGGGVDAVKRLARNGIGESAIDKCLIAKP